ncbi:hypothetical protein C8034_v008793 [Colletotrichum sidae]|uniref:Uncharacterized protein n=1 Tax=Colletotrichum sidae TaxID=1347389 RepID=A0A4R8T2A4_9PEZI|nr:hypothetical protein C8034_v008793 [Colletotrichum sidae]
MTILNPYNFNIDINLIKVVDNYKNYNYFYKNPKRLVLYKGNFITFFSLLKTALAIFSLNILLEDKATSRTKRKLLVVKKNLMSKSKVFKDNAKYLKYILEVAC